MTKYQMTKLVGLARKVEGRKRLQKVVYLLKTAGCPFEANFTLHLYGPYSHEIAYLLDKLVSEDLIEETCKLNPVGRQFDYELKPAAKRALKEIEQGPHGKKQLKPLKPYLKVASELLSKPVGDLELASTIAFFHKQCKSLDEAIKRTSEFKNVETHSRNIRRALKLYQTLPA